VALTTHPIRHTGRAIFQRSLQFRPLAVPSGKRTRYFLTVLEFAGTQKRLYRPAESEAKASQTKIFRIIFFFFFMIKINERFLKNIFLNYYLFYVYINFKILNDIILDQASENFRK